MALDNATYIAALSPADPAATDPVGEGDDHIRTLKVVLTNTFIGDIGNSDTYDSINGAVLIGPTELNGLPARIDAILTAPTFTGPVTITPGNLVLTAGDIDVTGSIGATGNLNIVDVIATGNVTGVDLIATGTITAGTGITLTTGDLTISAGDIIVSGLVDGRDMTVDGVKLDGIAPFATASNEIELASEVFAALYAYDTLG